MRLRKEVEHTRKKSVPGRLSATCCERPVLTSQEGLHRGLPLEPHAMTMMVLWDRRMFPGLLGAIWEVNLVKDWTSCFPSGRREGKETCLYVNLQDL